MGVPRSHLFDPSVRNVCHCISRCVRRKNLLAKKDRREALMKRMQLLTECLAIDVLEAAVMSNHLHVVTATNPDMAGEWSAREVATRFRMLCPDHAMRKKLKIPPTGPVSPKEIAAALTTPKRIAKWRKDLCSISFFHKLLKQKIAYVSNRQDKVTGHFWEGRFKSIVALDEPAIIAHMVYVALNPVRAGIAKSLEGCRTATVARRVKELQRRIAKGEFAGEAAAARERLRSVELLPAMPCKPGPELQAKAKLKDGAPNPWLNGRVPPVIDGSSLAMFLHDTDAEGREAAVGKSGCIPESTPRVLATLDAELAARVAEEAKASPLMRAARSIAGLLDRLAEKESFTIHGNFSGSPEAIARHALAMKKRFALGIVGSVESGGARRIRAAPEAEVKDTAKTRFKAKARVKAKIRVKAMAGAGRRGRRARARGAPLAAAA